MIKTTCVDRLVAELYNLKTDFAEQAKANLISGDPATAKKMETQLTSMTSGKK